MDMLEGLPAVGPVGQQIFMVMKENLFHLIIVEYKVQVRLNRKSGMRSGLTWFIKNNF